jgi:predicted MPP superfamily phosphohydrolase
MKFQLVSDLHLEFISKGQYIELDTVLDVPENSKETNLIVAGDLGYPSLPNYKLFLQEASKRYAHVFLVLGNHGYYQQSIDESNRTVQSIVELYSNVTLLNNDTHPLSEDLTIVGTTLWSPISSTNESYIKTYLNDYRCIYTDKMSGKLLKVSDVNAMYEENVNWLQHICETNKDKKLIIVTHHLPSNTKLIAERFKGSPLNEAFASDLEYLMKDNSNILYWCAGHTHSSFDIKIRNTRCLVNPKGYGSENVDYSGSLIFEV